MACGGNYPGFFPPIPPEDDAVTIPADEYYGPSTSAGLGHRTSSIPSSSSGSPSFLRISRPRLPQQNRPLMDVAGLDQAVREANENPFSPFETNVNPRELLMRYEAREGELRRRRVFKLNRPSWPRARRELDGPHPKGPELNIDQDLLNLIKDGEQDVLQVMPHLVQPLSRSNYAKKFTDLIRLEAACRKIALHTLDIAEGTFEKNGDPSIERQRTDFNCYKIRVPGLANGNPKLIPGDKIIAMTDEFGEVAFEGFVLKVQCNHVVRVAFNEDFEQIYQPNRRFNVSFDSPQTISRLQLHILDQLVPYLSNELLFPSSVDVWPPGTSSPINEEAISFINKSLDQRQRTAVINILKAPHRPKPYAYLIFGPPGTGKTITIVEAIIQTYRTFQNSQILVCASSNAAVDQLVRLLSESRAIVPGELCRLLAHNIDHREVGEDLQDLIVREDALVAEKNKYKIVVTTCGQSGFILYNVPESWRITHVFIDEASQSTEPEILIPLASAVYNTAQIILAGDPKQLGPVCFSKTSGKRGLGQSLMGRFLDSPPYHRDRRSFIDLRESTSGYNPEFVSKLITNYRSDPRIMLVPNMKFYDSELDFKYQGDAELISAMRFDSSNIFYNVEGAEKRADGTTSFYNALEADCAIRLLMELRYTAKVPIKDIGIITFYRAQVHMIQKLMDRLQIDAELRPKVATIEEFQGGERKVIIISTVRTSSSTFVFNRNRINVALTRAKDLVIVVGRGRFLALSEIWASFLLNCQEVASRQSGSAAAANSLASELQRMYIAPPQIDSSGSSSPDLYIEEEVITVFNNNMDNQSYS